MSAFPHVLADDLRADLDRGPDNLGVGAMRCGDCHHEMGN
jgi:hypothetical protein